MSRADEEMAPPEQEGDTEQLLVQISELLERNPIEIDADRSIISEFIEKVGFQRLFNALLSDDLDAQDYVIRALNKIFSSKFGLSVLTDEQIKPYLYGGLQSDSEKLRDLSLRQIQNVVKTSEDISFLTDSDLFSSLLNLLVDESPGIILQITNIFQMAAQKSDKFLISFWSNETMKILNEFGENDSTVLVRIYSLCNSIGKVSDNSFRLFINSGSLQNLLNQLLKTDDVLLQATLLEIVGEVGSSPSGLRYLSQATFLDGLTDLLFNAEVQSYSFICAAGLQLVDKLVEYSKQFKDYKLWEDSEKFIQLLTRFIDSKDTATKSVSIALVSTTCTIPNGFQLMIENSLASKVPQHVRSINEQIKITALHSLATMIQPLNDEDESKNQRDLIALISGSDGSSMSDSLNVLYRIVKEPFDDATYAALKLLSVIAKYSWGFDAILECGGLIEHIQDRLSARSKVASEWRFLVIKNLVKNPKINDAETERRFPSVKEHLTTYVEKGPFAGSQGQQQMSV